ncbi:MAG: MBL fold metallo-hydrolase [Planctomycetota bacterium]
MRFTFLGTGTSAGVPAIGSTNAAAYSDDPRDRRLRTSACLRFSDDRGQDRTILLDCGPDLRQQALAHNLTRCDAVLFTHNHVDHTWGVDELRRFNVLMDAPIDLFAEPRTIEHLGRVYQHIFDHELNVQKSFVARVIAHTIAPDVSFELFGLRITPVRLLHGKLPIVGFRFDPGKGSAERPLLPLAYCTDVSGIPPETWPQLRGLKHLVLDGLRYRKHPTHFTIPQAAEAADRIEAGRTWLVHMSDDVVHAEAEAELPENIRLAFDGLELS